MIKIALVNPDYSNKHSKKPPVLPVGLGYVAQALSSKAINYEVVDLNIFSPEYLLQKIEQICPDFVGFSLMSFRVEQNYEIINEIKKRFKKVKIIIGGPHTLAAGKEIFNECPGVDILVLGEGDSTIIDLSEKKHLTSIGNIMYRQNDKIFRNPQNKFIEINTLQFPKYEKFDLSKYDTGWIPLASSRGCVYKCGFCGARKFLGGVNRRRTSKKMFEEFKYWYDLGYKNFRFSDSLFTIDKKRIVEFCDFILDGGFNANFLVEGVRADNVDMDLLHAMKKANFNEVFLGVESASDNVLKFYNKGVKVDQIEATIKNTHKAGITTNLFFILGAPGETKREMIKSIKFSKKFTHVKTVYFFQLIPLVGTPLYDYLKQKGIKLAEKYPTANFGLTFNESYVINGMNPKVFKKIFDKAQKTSEFIKNRYSLKMDFLDRGIRIDNLFLLNSFYFCMKFKKKIFKGFKTFYKLRVMPKYK